MRDIWLFVQRYAHIFLFIGLELLAFQFLLTRNQFQRAKFLKQTATLQASISAIQTGIQDYFQLKKVNESLAAENAALREQYTQIPNTVQIDETMTDSLFTFQSARVISSPIYSANGYVTINKGKQHGIEQQDGVLSSEGIVGKVVQVSEKYALVMPITHQHFRLSALHETSKYTGNLHWNGVSYSQAQVEDITRNASINLQDQFVTSQYAKSFPQGSKIGKVKAIDYDLSGNFYQITIDIDTDFRKLHYVTICHRKDLDEIIELENTQP